MQSVDFFHNLGRTNQIHLVAQIRLTDHDLTQALNDSCVKLLHKILYSSDSRALSITY